MTSDIQHPDSGSGIGRRTFIKGVGVAGAAGVGLAHSDGPVQESEAIAPLLAASYAGNAAAAGLGYLAYRKVESFLGDRADDWLEDYTGEVALIERIAEGGLQNFIATEQVMTSIENNVTYTENILFPKGKVAMAEALNAGEGLETAKEDIEEAVYDHAAAIEENILTHIRAESNTLTHYVSQVESHQNLSADEDMFMAHFNDWHDWFVNKDGSSLDTAYNNDADWVEVELLDGSTMEDIPVYFSEHSDPIFYPHYTYAQQAFPENDFQISLNDPQPVFGGLRLDHDSTETEQPLHDVERVYHALDQLHSEVSRILTELEGLAEDIYAEWEPGDVDLTDVVDPITVAVELSQDYDGKTSQSAHAAMMGIPSSAGKALVLEVEDPETTDTVVIDADLYTERNPEGGFQVGETYDPEPWDEPVFVAYEYVATDEDGAVESETTDFEQLNYPFTVLEAYDTEGNVIDSFEPESRNTQTADIETFEAELEQIREEQIRLQEQAQEEQDDGGSGIGFGDFGTIDDFGSVAAGIVVVGFVGVALYQAALSLLPGN